MKNIVLVGMAGAGKSTVGVLLAKALGMTFIDTDIIIQDKEGKLLQEIIDEQGLDFFLQIEEKHVVEFEASNCIIATGGSVVYSSVAMEKLKKDGVVVYLDVPYDEIFRRLSNITTRGIVIKEGQTLLDIYNERVPLYEKYADIIMKLGGTDIEEVVTKTVVKIKEMKA